MIAPARRLSPRRYLAETLVGLAMIPLSLAPIYLYLSRTDDGYLMWLRGRYGLFAPKTPELGAAERAAARAELRDGLAGVPVLVYHGIGRVASDDSSGRFVVSRGRFAEHMRSLRVAGYRAVTTADLGRYLATRDERALPAKPVLITFDDGRSDAMIQADRILRDTGMRATMFVIGAAADSASFYYESWKHLARYGDNGRWELENHTYDLHRLHDLVKGREPVSALVDLEPGESVAAYRRRVAGDLDRVQRRLARMAGERPVAFAYPFGDWGSRAQAKVTAALDAVLRARFRVAFDQDDQGSWRPTLPGDNPMHVHRLEVMNWTGPELLDRIGTAARRSDVIYRERALGYRYSQLELSTAAAAARCDGGAPRPIRSRSGLGDRKLIALTFNGGPSRSTPGVLDVLKRANGVGTFFVRGDQVAGHENLLRRMLVEGSEPANGTYSGRRLGRARRARGEQELGHTSRLLREATGMRPCLARPPFGQRARRFARVASRRDLTAVLWSIDPADYALSRADEIARRVLARAKPGAIVNLHDAADRGATVQALQRIVSGLKARGYRLVTVSQLLAADDGRARCAACSKQRPRTSRPKATGNPPVRRFLASRRLPARVARPVRHPSAGAARRPPRVRQRRRHVRPVFEARRAGPARRSPAPAPSPAPVPAVTGPQPAPHPVASPPPPPPPAPPPPPPPPPARRPAPTPPPASPAPPPPPPPKVPPPASPPPPPPPPAPPPPPPPPPPPATNGNSGSAPGHVKSPGSPADPGNGKPKP